ncbi:hypothetical protein L905_26365 [Agrobacterium sp. TS43]|nr:hypothetical protein K538_26065 [Agrobacterium tumefaciens GW4]KVK41007.1 hypothetical protein L904_13590 [Agrobacterium sp. LY4]KVK70993.1 hypothetical protein L905_26365 [Agrobacterium sp. TS43]
MLPRFFQVCWIAGLYDRRNCGKRNSRRSGRELKILAARRRKTFIRSSTQAVVEREITGEAGWGMRPEILPFSKGYSVVLAKHSQDGNEFPQSRLK